MKMTNKIKVYYDELRRLTESIIVTDGFNRNLDLQLGIDKAIKLIAKCSKHKHKLIFIGNGASAAISSHMAADFLKNGKIRAVAFNDASLLTCVSNDLGYKYVFEKPIGIFADEGDLLIAISSSGKSENIIRAVKKAVTKNCKVITLSGFKKANILSRLGDLNFYVPVQKYSHVEIIHHSIFHYILDIIIETK